MLALGILLIALVHSSRLFNRKNDYKPYNMMPPDMGSPPYNSTNTNELGICYGSSTSWNNYPYVAALRYQSGSACCSASILSKNPGILLTAAHCNQCIGTAWIGCNNPANCNGGLQGISVSQFTQHPNYQASIINNDVGLVRLAGAITVTSAKEIPVPTAEIDGGETLRLTGYGITQTGSIPSTLQTMTSPKLPSSQCDDIYREIFGSGTIFNQQTMICILNSGNNPATMCSGDSGGPMVFQNQVYGINSWVVTGSGGACSDSCNCCSGYPQTGANAANFHNWIYSTVNQWKKEYYYVNGTNILAKKE